MMRPFGLLVTLMLLAAMPAAAADPLVVLTLDGRPVDKHGGIAVLHGGIVYADAIDLTKSFNGLISLDRGGTATVTIGGSTGRFVPGARFATIAGTRVPLPGRAFMRNGDLYVPLAFFARRIARVQVRINRAKTRADILVGATTPG